MLIKTQQLCQRVLDLIGEETLVRELEGILRKHRGISRRSRKPGRVSLCLTEIEEYLREGQKVLTPRQVAGIVLRYHLSPASVYRLARVLRRKGWALRAVDILQEEERMKAGIY